MKKQSLFMLGLLVISTVFSLSCMNREPAPVCPVPTELKQTDPGLTDFDGVDILVVVDNSNSMEQEQAILATAFFPLVNTLIYPLPGDGFQGTDNIRIAITTSDMGVSYDGKSYDKKFEYDLKCEGSGNNGDFISEYLGGNEVEIESGVIPCGANAAQCPPNWVCGDIGDDQKGTCEPAAGDDNMVSCPRSPEERNMEFVDRDWDDKALAVACLANVGTTGCNFEQQLSAAAAGLKNTLNDDGTRSTFLRERKVTTIIIVSDEEDCSLKDDRWHSVPELGTAETNLACGKHTNYLFDVDELKDSYEDSVRKIVGTTKGLVFAAIVGVPPGESRNSKCEGIGEDLDECGGVKPGVNGTQTMEDPEIVEREVGTANSIQNYYEYACQRWATGTSEEDGDEAVTSAYPGMRFVKMAQEFGENGYVYSICHEDWSPAMNAIAGLIAENLGGSCFEKRLNWDPESETAGCNVVFEYRADRSESAPECPSSGKWIDKGELTVDGDEWVRKCSVEKIPTAITCTDIDYTTDVGNKFGWYYCENPGENNSVACNDGQDNDRDGLTDFDDPDCDKCRDGDTAECPTDCPYKVSLTETALAEASNADDANVVCLQQYRFEDPNCKESTRDACNDGEDNDGNGPFDCWSYAKGETIPNDQNPKKGARNADPDCCPMTVGDGGACQFVDFRGNPVSNMGNAAYIDTCDVGTAPRDIPDACCEAAKARLCRLPDDLRRECDIREGVVATGN